MDTHNEMTGYNNFIYALGLICLFSILSSEMDRVEIKKDKKIQHATLLLTCNQQHIV